MDIAALSIASSQNNLITQVSASVLAMNMDTIENTGAGLVKMMEQSVNPNLGQSVDIRI